MRKIISTNITDKTILFAITHTRDYQKLSDYVGKTIAAVRWAIVEDDETGMRSAFLQDASKNAPVIATNSGSAIATLQEIVDVFGAVAFAVSVHSAKSRAGRSYVYLEMADYDQVPGNGN